MKRFLLSTACLLSLFLLCCANQNMDELFRTYDDPFDDTPQVSYTDRILELSLSWRQDDAADSFILLRASDSEIPAFVEVYRGSNTSYTDSFSALEGSKLYLYRLDKTRGHRTFQGERCTFAAVDFSTTDAYEPNDVPSMATNLEYVLYATLQCRQFQYEKKVWYDVDWYSVTVPPHRSASILLEQTDIQNTSVNTDLCWMEESGEWHYTAGNTPFLLSNTSLHTQNIHFAIIPNLAQVFGGGAVARTLSYRLTVTAWN